MSGSRAYFANRNVNPIRAYLAVHGLDLREWSRRVGISRTDLYRFMRGERPVSGPAVDKLARATGIPKAYWRREGVTLRVTEG